MPTLLWDRCLKYLERELSGQDFNTWIRPLHALEENGTLQLLAPNQFVLDWVQRQFYQRIATIITHLAPHQTPTVILQVGSRKVPSAPLAKTTTSKKRKKTESTKAPITPIIRLNPKLTFNNFVTGKTNQLAQAASLEVAEDGYYSPLFLYGGVGLGKTHLMQAVGNHLLAQRPNLKISYIHSERFTSDMVNALRHKKMNNFKEYYRSMDALLIDDVQFFAGKKQSQEELFHTFNSLLDSKKLIILTANHIPQNITGLQDRLSSRFSWGLTVGIEPPDINTRVEILMAKAHLAQVKLPDEVGHFVASNIHNNVRELEGALHRLIMTARVRRQNITLTSAQDALKDLITTAIHQIPQLDVIDIQKIVSSYFSVSIEDMCSRKRTRAISRPRQIAITLCKEFTAASLLDIGKAFGNRDHSTVLHSYKMVEKLKNTDQQVKSDYDSILSNLSR